MMMLMMMIRLAGSWTEVSPGGLSKSNQEGSVTLVDPGMRQVLCPNPVPLYFCSMAIFLFPVGLLLFSPDLLCRWMGFQAVIKSAASAASLDGFSSRDQVGC